MFDFFLLEKKIIFINLFYYFINFINFNLLIIISLMICTLVVLENKLNFFFSWQEYI